jgi:membrane fusion protein (multidrug efflux system)
VYERSDNREIGDRERIDEDGGVYSEEVSPTPAPDQTTSEQAGTATVKSEAADVPAKPARKRLLPAVLTAGVIALLSGGVYYGHYYWTVGRYMVSTDDAYVGARSTVLSPKVSGYIAEVLAGDNAHVKAGDILLRIDDGDYRLAVQTAKDQVAVQEAVIERLRKQELAQEALVEQARAQVDSAKAGLVRAQLELKRQQDLTDRKVASRQTFEQAQAAYEQAVASVKGAEAAVTSAQANVAVLKAQVEEASRTLKQLQTAQAKAERDLSFTVVRAPFDGVVGNRAVQVGDYVQPTQRLAALVPLEAVYIDANFKETQLADLHPGQPVSIRVDAFPGRVIQGRVDSVAPASGSVFSLLPPDNATGNFTKIVQRIPVRIHVEADVTEESILRPGMSVVVKIDTKPGAPAPTAAMSTAALPGVVR